MRIYAGLPPRTDPRKMLATPMDRAHNNVTKLLNGALQRRKQTSYGDGDSCETFQ